MNTRSFLLVLAASGLASCATTPRTDPSSFYYPSSNKAIPSRTAGSTYSSSAQTGRSGHAPGSGPTSMPPESQFMYQQRETGIFGSRSTSGVIRSSGGVQSYQTIGGAPVYPGATIPGYHPNQPFYGTPSSQPVYVPGVGGSPGYYINPATGQRVRVGP